MPGDDARRLLGRLGVWSGELRDAGRPQAREAAVALGAQGLHTLWIPGLLELAGLRPALA